MIRRSRLERKTRLQANPETTIGWQRRTRKPLPPVSEKRRAALPARHSTKDEVIERDGGCVMREVFYEVCGGPLDAHHLEKEGQGGAYTLDNLVCLCRRHNGWVEDDPQPARALGLVVRPGITPAEAYDRRVAYGLVVATERPTS